MRRQPREQLPAEFLLARRWVVQEKELVTISAAVFLQLSFLLVFETEAQANDVK